MSDDAENQATQVVEPSPFSNSPLTEYTRSPCPAPCPTVNPQEIMIREGIETQCSLWKQPDAEEYQSNPDSAEDTEMLGGYLVPPRNIFDASI